jgi:hypothetical protein
MTAFSRIGFIFILHPVIYLNWKEGKLLLYSRVCLLAGNAKERHSLKRIRG